MYDDQAAELRNLIHQSAIKDGRLNAPWILVLTGGKSGVGTSTVAANLATVIARQGRRTVIVDADPCRGDMQSICLPKADDSTGIDGAHGNPAGIDSGPTFSTVAAGLKLLIAPWNRGGVHPVKPHSLSEINRFSRSLRKLGDHAEYVIVDAGNGVSAEARSLWASADVGLVTTTPDSVSIMDCYVVVKSILEARRHLRVMALVNQSPNANTSLDVFRRLDQSCRRFLGQALAFGGAIPLDPLLANSGDGSTPVVLRTPNSSAVRAMEEVVRQVQASFAPSAKRLA